MNENKVPEFDLDRLAQEIDGIFQGKLADSILNFDKDISKTADEWRIELEENLKEHNTVVRKTVEAVRVDILKEVMKGRAVINLPDNAEIEVDHMDHPKMESVVSSLVSQRKAMLVGPAGTGKTYMIAEIAKRLGLAFYKYSCSRDSSVHDLLGYKQPKSETYLETSFLNAYENGGIFLVDEYDAMSGDMSLFFNGVADNSKFISIPHRDEKPTAKKHKDFYLVMCGNTWGQGSTDYSGRDFQDMALMDRFRFCRHHIGYHYRLEEVLVGENINFIKKLRKNLEEVGSYLSTRNVEDLAQLIRLDISREEIVSMICQDLSGQDAETILQSLPVIHYHLAPLVEDTSKVLSS